MLSLKAANRGRSADGVRRGGLFAILLLTAVLGGCAEKAKTVQLGAAQFETASLDAIDKIDAFRQKEVSTASLSPADAGAGFVAQVLGSQRPIDQKTLEILADPMRSDLPHSEAAWQAFLAKLRDQYGSFRAIFDSLDRGSLFAAPDVKKAIPTLDPLIAQMTAFAKSIQDHPARFIRERAAIAAELEIIRDDREMTADAKRTALLRTRQRLLDTLAAEELVTRETSAECLKVSRLGLELRKLLAAYDTLTFEDLTEGLEIAFRVAGSVSDRDFSGLRARTNGVIAEISADPDLKALFDAALNRIGRVREIGP